VLVLQDVSKSRKIMAVDDDFDILHIVRRYLEKWGFSVDTFTNPLYAYQQFKKSPNAYSVIILDIRKPEMSGVELAAMMIKVKPDAKIIIMTAYEITAAELTVSLPKIKNDDILRKPFRLMQICNAVNNQLQTG
jgi:two-component system response regulator TrcR